MVVRCVAKISGTREWQGTLRRLWYQLRRQLEEVLRGSRTAHDGATLMHRLAEVATKLAVRFDGHMGGVARLLGGEIMAENTETLP